MATLITRLRMMVGDPSGSPAVYSAWQAAYVYALGDQRRPTAANSHFYRVTVAGTSAASEPPFPTNGGSVIDGTVVWQDEGVIPSSSTAAFSDDELQMLFDERRTDVIEGRLHERPTLVGGGVKYLDFFSPRAPWEDSVILTGLNGQIVTPDTSDLVAAHWAFITQPSLVLYITGSFYDLYGTAAAVCDAWAAKVALEFDFGTDGQTFDRTGKRTGLLAVAREFARKAGRGTRPSWRSADW